MSDMTPDKALMIVDPDTREAALTGAMGCRPLRAEYIAEACRVLAADYRKLREGLGLATAGLAGALADMRDERDAAVRDLESMMFDFRCTSFCLKRNLCVTQNCYMRGTGATSCCPKWRGPQPEQVLAPADQSAGAYADNPVLAQA